MNFLSEASSYIVRSLEERSLVQDHEMVESSERDVVFDSRFESANLMYVFERPSHVAESPAIKDYYLVLQHDINSKGYGNWFYFKITSKQPKTFRIHILNVQKNFSYFNSGMRPVIFSLRKNQAKGMQWHHDGYELSYQHNHIPKDSNTKGLYNTLTFMIDQTLPNEVLYVAASQPYTYSRLINYL